MKHKGRSRRAKVGAQSERVEEELKGKFLPFSTFFFLFYGFFSFLLLEKKKVLGESL